MIRPGPRGKAWLWAVALAPVLAGCAGVPDLGPPTGGPIDRLAFDEARASRMISAYRETHGASEVTIDPVLDRVASRQAYAMAAADQLSHTLAGALPERLAAADADRSAAIENVSAGYGSIEAAIGGWRRSPAHDANLLFGPMRRMGIAAVEAPATRYKTFWALVMTN